MSDSGLVSEPNMTELQKHVNTNTNKSDNTYKYTICVCVCVCETLWTCMFVWFLQECLQAAAADTRDAHT